ncbi:LOB domain-containing protein 16-like [Diospyros lotus]|uniref:LOB domain-containing protein 16-like n=1 Tax=Diospyros lotus TaxID=55363 RepID=UPI00225578AA|nr:LOB domain-containing protein 16-like [Diospyros lotus]
MATATGTGSPCGACKFLRRKCAADCIFAPYFCSEQGPARFAAIHKVFGASNVSKLLLQVPVADRCEAVFTIAYEAQARLRDPVYGCVANIFALQQQVTCLQAQLMQAKAQLVQSQLMGSRNVESQWPGNMLGLQPSFPTAFNPSQSSLESVDQGVDGMAFKQEIQSRSSSDHHELSFLNYAKKRPSQTELGELQELALRMMRN